MNSAPALFQFSMYSCGRQNPSEVVHLGSVPGVADRYGTSLGCTHHSNHYHCVQCNTYPKYNVLYVNTIVSHLAEAQGCRLICQQLYIIITKISIWIYTWWSICMTLLTIHKRMLYDAHFIWPRQYTRDCCMMLVLYDVTDNTQVNGGMMFALYGVNNTRV